MWAGVAVIVAYAIGTPILLIVINPVRRALNAVESGKELSAHEQLAARKRALNLPDIQARISSLLWFGAAATLPLYNQYSEADFPFLPIAILTAAILLTTTSLTVILYIVISFLGIGALQGAFISASISKPVGRLTEAMQTVKQNDFSVQVPSVSVDQIGQLSEGFNQMVKGLAKAEFVKETFGRYVTRQVLEEILNGKIELGGELRLATVLFSDIRGFTALAEKLPPADVVDFLNHYLDIMVEVLVQEGGTIDKFMGDAIMASFGVPVSAQDDALRAIRAAVGMKEQMKLWNLEREKHGLPFIEIGIGLHTGWVIAGNIGSSRKMEYTIIGDTVNTSSRIEQLNKHFSTTLLISEQTFELISDFVDARRLDPVAVKGKQEPVTVYEVLGLRSMDSKRSS